MSVIFCRRTLLKYGGGIVASAALVPLVSANPLVHGSNGWQAFKSKGDSPRKAIVFEFPIWTMVAENYGRVLDWQSQDPSHLAGPTVTLYVNESFQVLAQVEGYAHASARAFAMLELYFTDDPRKTPVLLTSNSVSFPNALGCKNDPSSNLTVDGIGVFQGPHIDEKPLRLFDQVSYCLVRWSGAAGDCWTDRQGH